MAVKITPLAAVIAFLWVILAFEVVSHETLLFCSGAGRLAGSPASHQSSLRPNLQRKCEGGEAEVLPQSTRRIFEGREVIPLTAAFLTLATFASMSSDPWANRAQQRTRNTLPFSRSLEQFSEKIGQLMPARAEKMRAEQMDYVASVALVAPVTMAIATRKGGPIYSDGNSWDAAEEFLRELVIGCIYEGKDAGGNYWAFTATATNPDGTYTGRLVGEEFEDEPVWPTVWVENCRRVKYPLSLPEEVRQIVG